MKKIGERADENGLTHIVEITDAEFRSFNQLRIVCDEKDISWFSIMEPPRIFEGEFERVFLAIRLFMEAQLRWNELSCMVDKFAGLLWPENEIEETE